MPNASHTLLTFTPPFLSPLTCTWPRLHLLTCTCQVFVPFVSDVRVGNFGEEEGEERERRDTRYIVNEK